MTPATEHVVQAWAGNLLRLARAEKGSSRRDLAKPLGCPVCIVAKIESAGCGVRPKLSLTGETGTHRKIHPTRTFERSAQPSRIMRVRIDWTARSRLGVDDHRADFPRSADVLGCRGDLIECVGARDAEFCGVIGGDLDDRGDVGGAAFGRDAAEPPADRYSSEADFAANKIRAVQRDAFLGYLSVTEQRSAGSQQGYQVAGDGAADGVQCRGNGPAVGDGANLLDPVRAVGRDDGHVGVPRGELVGSGGAAHDADRGDVMASGDGTEPMTAWKVGVSPDVTVTSALQALPVLQAGPTSIPCWS